MLITNKQDKNQGRNRKIDPIINELNNRYGSLEEHISYICLLKYIFGAKQDKHRGLSHFSLYNF